MEFNARETLVLRIISGSIHINVNSRDFLVKTPSPETRYKAQLLYNRRLNELQSSSLLSEDQLIDFLLRNNLWSIEDQSKLDSLPKDIENLKVQLYELVFKSNQRKEVKALIKRGKEELRTLRERRSRFQHITPEGNASISKLYYLIGSSLYYYNTDRKVYKSDKWIDKPNGIIHQVIIEYNRAFIEENIYRELARTEPWRSIWNAAKSDTLFGVPSISLSDEQKSLVFWSRLYDNIYENPDCPDDEIIEDDDMLDGWLISERRKRDKEKGNAEAERIAARHGNASEIFVVAETAEDIKKINEMNSPTSKMIKRQRAAAINQAGVLDEADLPDVARDIQTKANQMYFDKMKNK